MGPRQWTINPWSLSKTSHGPIDGTDSRRTAQGAGGRPARDGPGAGSRPWPLAWPVVALARQTGRRGAARALRAGTGRLAGRLPGAGGQRAGGERGCIPAHRRRGRAHRCPDPGASGGGGGRRDRLGQDHPAAQAVPGRRPRRGRDDRLHPAAPDRGPSGGRACGRGAEDTAGRDGRLPGALHRQRRSGHPDQVHDRRHPAGRDRLRPLAVGLRHDHRRRGPRAQSQHRFPAGLPQAASAQAPRPEADRDLGHDRYRALRQAFRRRARGRGGRAHLPGRSAVPACGRGGRWGRRAGGFQCAPGARRARAGPAVGDHRRHGRDQRRGPARRRAGVPARRTRDPRRAPRAGEAPVPFHRSAAAVRAAVGARPGPGVQPRPAAAHRAGHQRRRDLADRAADPLRGRSGRCAGQALQPAFEDRPPARGADQPGQRQPAQGPLRPHRRGRVLPALRRGRLPLATGVHRSGDPPRQPGRGDPADVAPGAGAG